MGSKFAIAQAYVSSLIALFNPYSIHIYVDCLKLTTAINRAKTRYDAVDILLFCTAVELSRICIE